MQLQCKYGRILSSMFDDNDILSTNGTVNNEPFCFQVQLEHSIKFVNYCLLHYNVTLQSHRSRRPSAEDKSRWRDP